MTRPTATRALVAALAALASLASACSGDAAPEGSEEVTRASAIGDCLRPDGERPERFLQADCGSEQATVEIIDMTDPRTDGPTCPPGTDVLVDGRQGPVIDGEIVGRSDVWCLRHLAPPHPGDPGNGGAEVVVGDCFALDGEGGEAGRTGAGQGGRAGRGGLTVVEAACAADPPPAYRLLATAARTEDCPPEAAEPIEMATPVGVLCAEPLDAEAEAGQAEAEAAAEGG